MREHQDGDHRGEAALRGAEGWGWDLVQRDWSLRQREPARPRARVLAGLLARFEAGLAWTWRLIRSATRSRAPRDRAHDTAR